MTGINIDTNRYENPNPAARSNMCNMAFQNGSAKNIVKISNERGITIDKYTRLVLISKLGSFGIILTKSLKKIKKFSAIEESHGGMLSAGNLNDIAMFCQNVTNDVITEVKETAGIYMIKFFR